MSIFKNPAVLENGTYRFDLGGGRFIRAIPDPRSDLFNVRCVDGGKTFAKARGVTAEMVDVLFDVWDAMASWDTER